MVLSRRIILQALAMTAFLRPAHAATLTVYKSPGCDCCEGWIAHLRENGFDATVNETSEINRVKSQLGLPLELVSCHTAEVEGYVLEGHVPAAALRRLLNERPKARGLAVAGMPSGSPGMSGEPEEYDVMLFGPDQTRAYARFKGDKQL